MNKKMIGLIAGGIALVGVSATGFQRPLMAQQPPPTSQDPRDAVNPTPLEALPGKLQLPDFDKFKAHNTGLGKDLFAERISDGLLLRLSVSVCPSADAALAAALDGFSYNSDPGGMHPRSPSGRRIGERVWSSTFSPEDPIDTFSLVVADGPVLINVNIGGHVETDGNHRIIHDEIGRPIVTLLTVKDIRLAEDEAIACLKRLAKLGYVQLPVVTGTAPPLDAPAP